MGEPERHLIDDLGEVDPTFRNESAWGTNAFLGSGASASHRPLTQP